MERVRDLLEAMIEDLRFCENAHGVDNSHLLALAMEAYVTSVAVLQEPEHPKAKCVAE
ncbi:MAG: hypothetical protein AAGK33_11940 [Pseudomonadota bacterium]